MREKNKIKKENKKKKRVKRKDFKYIMYIK